MNETTQRFLKAVLERVHEAHVVEVRLFPAIRQGGMESGVAVLAVEPDVWAISASASAGVPTEAAGEPTPSGTADGEAIAVEGASHSAPAIADGFARHREVEVTLTPTDGLADRDVPADGEESMVLGDILALPSPAPNELVGDASADDARRLAILCARYVLTLKGPERGKWLVEVVHQADAPLLTLDRVIAGVVRRSGEEGEPLRYSRASLRESLDTPAWAQSA